MSVRPFLLWVWEKASHLMPNSVRRVLLWVWAKGERLLLALKVARPIRYHLMVIGNTLNCHEDFMRNLSISVRLCEVSSVGQSDVIIAFVPIVSRAGTDIQAALQQIPASRSVVLVVLHHTFDPYAVVPESRRSVPRAEVFTVDCVFSEDRGLLTCTRNTQALTAAAQHLSDITQRTRLPA